MSRKIIIAGHPKPHIASVAANAGHNVILVKKGTVSTYRNIYNSFQFKFENKQDLEVVNNDVKSYDDLILQYELIKYKKCQLSSRVRKSIVSLYDATRNFRRR